MLIHLFTTMCRDRFIQSKRLNGCSPVCPLTAMDINRFSDGPGQEGLHYPTMCSFLVLTKTYKYIYFEQIPLSAFFLTMLAP
jgi:hypothetical protein